MHLVIIAVTWPGVWIELFTILTALQDIYSSTIWFFFGIWWSYSMHRILSYNKLCPPSNKVHHTQLNILFARHCQRASGVCLYQKIHITQNLVAQWTNQKKYWFSHLISGPINILLLRSSHFLLSVSMTAHLFQTLCWAYTIIVPVFYNFSYFSWKSTLFTILSN
jgi:hypothetical protein